MVVGLNGNHATEIICVERPNSIDEVNEPTYLSANPDVRKTGMLARDHFRLYGQREGRLQWANLDQVAEMRERKLRLLTFRRKAGTPRDYGQPASFLTPEIVAEFDIPDAPPVSDHPYGGPFIDEIHANPERLCLDVGAGLRRVYTSNMVYSDIYPSISTDVLCIGEDLPFDSDQFDYVICVAVLEHTRRPWDVAREICRVLKPGGKVLVDYPFLQGVHGYPHHYFNATPQGSITLFERYCDIISSTIEPNNHPIQSIWWLLSSWRHDLKGADREQFEKLTIGELLARSPDHHFDAAYCRNLSETARRTIPAGSTLIARKKEDGMCGESLAASSSSSGGSSQSGRNDYAALEAEVAALRASRSWRLTAPLREFHRAFRRLAKN